MAHLNDKMTILSAEMTKEIVQYIEQAEVMLDGEFGAGLTLSELVKGKHMPDVYYKIIKIANK